MKNFYISVSEKEKKEAEELERELFELREELRALREQEYADNAYFEARMRGSSRADDLRRCAASETDRYFDRDGQMHLVGKKSFRF